MPYIYLIHCRASINISEPVYKVGKTTDFNKRLSGYDKGTEPILVLYVIDCDLFERTILDIFNTTFKKRTDYGSEYFEGDINAMIHLIITKFNECNMCYSIKSNENIIQPTIIMYNDILFIKKQTDLVKILNKVNTKNISQFINNYTTITNGIREKTNNYIQLSNSCQNEIYSFNSHVNQSNTNRIHYIPVKLGDYFQHKNPNLIYEITNKHLNSTNLGEKQFYNIFKSIIP